MSLEWLRARLRQDKSRSSERAVARPIQGGGYEIFLSLPPQSSDPWQVNASLTQQFCPLCTDRSQSMAKPIIAASQPIVRSTHDGYRDWSDES
jgi:hypothetical protein